MQRRTKVDKSCQIENQINKKSLCPLKMAVNLKIFQIIWW